MRTVIRSTVAALVLSLISVGTAQASTDVVRANNLHAVQNKSGGRGHTSPILYHGGPLMIGTPNIYVIWYGSWSSTSTTPAILTDFLSNDGGSPYYNINTTYYDGSGTHLSNAVHYVGSVSQSAPVGSTVDPAAVVSNAVSSGSLPSDSNGVYFVLTSADIRNSGFLTSYCGYHSNTVVGSATIKYAFIGDPSRNLSACSAQTASSPNNNVPADAMASVVAHELEESTSDPLLDAWFDRSGQENADKCAWSFGTELTASNGSKYNMTIGTRKYLIQQNWVNSGNGFCALSF